jgi:hypothetical protein
MRQADSYACIWLASGEGACRYSIPDSDPKWMQIQVIYYENNAHFKKLTGSTISYSFLLEVAVSSCPIRHSPLNMVVVCFFGSMARELSIIDIAG